ncbi:MAG TPA: hypothetical protein VFY10_02390, partial [Dehalococcoidia bacterium]|nr:hypothetical protein [Dehalococcoidia bacterium]
MGDASCSSVSADRGGRYQLWSLIDMLQMYAGFFTLVMTTFARATDVLVQMRAEGYGEHNLSQAKREELTKDVNIVLAELRKLPLSIYLTSKAERLINQTQDERFTYSMAETLCKELQNDIVMEMSSHLYLVVPYHHAQEWIQKAPPFGSEVEDQFPLSRKDIRASTRLLALDEWTASVFHAMRAIEQALHYMAHLLNVKVPGDIEYNDWGPIVGEMTKEIEKMKQLPKGQIKD